jgi:hypothetical protein
MRVVRILHLEGSASLRQRQRVKLAGVLSLQIRLSAMWGFRVAGIPSGLPFAECSTKLLV